MAHHWTEKDHMGSRIAIIGTGYVGLTTGACFAHIGHDVVCADIDPGRIERLKNGILPIFEPGLQEIVEAEIASGRLQFVVGAAEAAKDCEFAYLCVQTPQGEDGAADLTYLQQAAAEIASVLPANSVVVNKSTVPVGSTKVVERVLGRHDVSVVSNPEFLREGQAVTDWLKPDRVVIGSDNPSASTRVAELYDATSGHVIITDPASAETIKYAANAFLATKISFINAVAAVCEAVGADVNDVVLGIGYDKRIGHEFLRPGPGWGGSCFPKDTRAMVKIAEDAGYDFNLLKGVVVVNDEQLERMVVKVKNAVGGDLAGKTVAAWGLTFKANTDDLRESPAIAIITELMAQGATVKAYDPQITEHKTIEVGKDPYEICQDADALIVLTEWDAFRWLDLETVKERLANANIVDTRNLLDRAAAIRMGFTYQGVGR
ncbi:MAG: ugd [Ilumatobacteraceae bacterium]|nr:ugd [Ilumatobacteraceae bacterium]